MRQNSLYPHARWAIAITSAMPVNTGDADATSLVASTWVEDLKFGA